jgi:hypothetical protein
LRGIKLGVAARVLRDDGRTPVTGGHVEFEVFDADGRIARASAPVDADGRARAKIPSEMLVGDYRVRASFSDGASDEPSFVEENLAVRLSGAALAYIGSNGAFIGNEVQLAARLTDDAGGALPGRDVDFRIVDGDATVQTVHARADGEGEARATVSLDGSEGEHVVEAAFAGDDAHAATVARVPFTARAYSTTLVYTGPKSAGCEDAVPVTALLRRKEDSSVVAGEHVTFALVRSGDVHTTVEAVTDDEGVAHASLTADVAAGDYRIEASSTGRAAYGASKTGADCRVTRRETTAGYAGATTATYGEPLALRANLYRSGGAAIGGRDIRFEITSDKGVTQNVTAITAASGLASTSLAVTAPAGKYRVVARFDGDATFAPASGNATIDVVARPTSLAVTAPTAGSSGSGVTFSATLTDAASGSRLSGTPVEFKVGETSTRAVTGEDGRASVEMVMNQPPAGYTVTARFAGDGTHLGSEATSPFEIH